LREELEAAATADERPVVTAVCTRNGWDVCIPLTAGPQLRGFIALGRKRTLDAFFADDLDLLGTLAAQASIALENARLYEELKRSQEIIRRSDRLSALGTLAAGIAHEVRNPLVSIQTFFQLAPDRLHDEEFLTRFLDLTANEVKRIATLIDELLSFARSPTRALQATDLNEIAERVVTLLEGEAHKARVSLTHVLTPALPSVLADADQIKQVLLNIVLNALQATPPNGSVTVISRAVEVQHEPFGQLEIRDTGVGIAADALESIFNPFYTTKDKGTGLGLTIAHQIITEHGGVLTAESVEGQGTSFFIGLPAAVQTGAAERRGEDGFMAEYYERPRKVASS
jgi:signal transduction histidine kinase